MNKNSKIVVVLVGAVMMMAVIILGIIASNAYEKLNDTQSKLQRTEIRLDSAKSTISDLKDDIEKMSVAEKNMFEVLISGSVKYDAFELSDGSHICFTKQTNGGYSFISVSNK